LFHVLDRARDPQRELRPDGAVFLQARGRLELMGHLADHFEVLLRLEVFLLAELGCRAVRGRVADELSVFGRLALDRRGAPLVMPRARPAVACGGVGGHEAGEVASGIAVDTVKRFFELTSDPQAAWRFRYDRSKDEGWNLLSVAAQWANQRIHEASERAKA